MTPLRFLPRDFSDTFRQYTLTMVMISPSFRRMFRPSLDLPWIGLTDLSDYARERPTSRGFGGSSDSVGFLAPFGDDFSVSSSGGAVISPAREWPHIA